MKQLVIMFFESEVNGVEEVWEISLYLTKDYVLKKKECYRQYLCVPPNHVLKSYTQYKSFKMQGSWEVIQS